jgi:nucleotide-binding universal stress UspA family protein
MLSTKPTVVVGVDGTPEGEAALRVALREAALRGCAVEVVTCWQPLSWDNEGIDGLTADVVEEAQSAQDRTVTAVLAISPDRPVVSRRVVEGAAGPSLVGVARGAEFLVVGTHRKNFLKRSVLGSVSEHCIRHATCPVIVVPPPEEQKRSSRDDAATQGAHHVGA